MTSRIKVVKSLNALGIKPKHKQYGEYVTQFLLKEFKIDDSEKNESLVKTVALDFAHKVKRFYVACAYQFKYLLQKKKDWLNVEIKNPVSKSAVSKPKTAASKPKKGRPKKNKGGRPKQDYTEITPGGSQQSVKASKIIADHSFEEMLHALIIKADRDGLTDAHFVLTQLKKSPENASKIRESIENPPKPVIVMTPEECLATVLEMKLTVGKYKSFRKKQKYRNAKIFVSWHDVLKVKKKCEPNNGKDIDSKTKVGVIQVPMQSAVNHQITKIMEKPYVRERYNDLLKSGRQFKLTMYGKYGADGTTTDADYQTADAGEYSMY